MEGQSKELLEAFAQAIYDKKGFNILALDVQAFSSIADAVLIAEGNVPQHLQAISDELSKVAKDHGIKADQVEGLAEGKWVVMDFGGLVVHLFVPEWRGRYRLEQLLQEGKIIDLAINSQLPS